MNDYKEIINKVLRLYNRCLDFEQVYEMWNKPYRHFHNTKNHLFPTIDEIIRFGKLYNAPEELINELIFLAIFHDIVYDPKSSTNEEDSASYMKYFSYMYDNIDLTKFEQAILETKNHKPTFKLSELFCEMDLKILTSDFAGLLKYEDQIFKEFEFVNWKEYQEKRLEVLKSFLHNPMINNDANITALIQYIEHRKPNIAVFAGSFNPFTIAHKNILNKSEQLFDKVIIAKGKNDSKEINEEEFEREFQSLKTLFPYKEVATYSGLLTDFLKSEENITLIRGIRNVNDLYSENKTMIYMKDMYNDLKFIYIPCDPEYSHISSTDIRLLKKYGNEYIKKYLP